VVKCSEVLQYSDGVCNKVSNIIRNLYIFIVTSVYSYCMFMYLHRANWQSSATMSEVFPCFYLNCKANTRVKPAKMGHGLHSSTVFVLFYVLFVFCLIGCSMYCVNCVVLCVVLCLIVLFYVSLCCSMYCLC